MADETRPAAITSEVADKVGEDQQRHEYAAAASGASIRDAWQTPTAGHPGEDDSLADVADVALADLLAESEREWQRLRREAVTQFLDSWWGGAAQATVLDYSGGVGTDALHFAETCRAAYYLLDSTSQTTTFALKRFAQQGAAISTVSSTDGYSARFDALVAFDVLEHLPDPAAQLDAMVRLTRTGGMLFLSANHPPSGALDHLDELMAARGCQAVTLLVAHVHAYVKGPALTVAVPVYNAYDHVCRLMESMRSTTPGYPIHWLFVNDASPDPRIAGLLQTFARDFAGLCQSCAVIDRADNRGFPLTANEAMEAAGANDVILLNSDTIVYDAWARKLVQAAYSDPRIGTVNPLCNNASIYSVFEAINVNNNVNWSLGLADLPLVDIPVGVGFCLYIKRELLDRVGAFDPVFGKGYGEETDFCLRASEAGYRHVLAPTVFVYHAGNASMVEANVLQKGQRSIKAHERLVMSRYPHYSQTGLAFAASGTTGRLQWELSNRYIALESSRRPSIAAVVHDDVFSPVVGGTTDHLRDVVRELGSDFVFYFITPSPSEDSVVVTAYVDGVRQRLTPYEVEYSGLLAELNPSLIHIHHLLNFNPSFIEALIAWNGPKFFTTHDYFAVCKQFTLLNYKGEYCNVPGPEECGRCAHALWGTNYDAVAARRAVFQRLVDSCSLVIAPSATALEIFRKGISVPDAKADVLPHPAVMQKYRDSLLDPFRRDVIKPKVVKLEADPEDVGDEAAHAVAADQFSAADESTWTAAQQRKAREAVLRVGVLGYNAPQKGTMLVKGIIAACAHDPILFVSIGEVAFGASDQPNVVSTGQYERLDVVRLIESYKVDIIVVASIWPETYCYTVSESWMAGVPVMTGPLGAQAERARATGAGMALDDLKVKTFVQALRGLVTDRSRLDAMKVAAAHVVPATDYDTYRERYLRATGGVGSTTHLFSAVSGQQPQAGSPSLSGVPLIAKLVGVRKRIFPVGSGREKFYFWLHDRVTHSYAGHLHG
jgi:GT2 family glycosyltransferase/glycosyltransferase involved in cell wall biosynthesis/2-polyprenyl-3-methyl-5-hydroxy-6-metoxy-1,4-benzoquinol methylase